VSHTCNVGGKERPSELVVRHMGGDKSRFGFQQIKIKEKRGRGRNGGTERTQGREEGKLLLLEVLTGERRIVFFLVEGKVSKGI